MEWVGGDWGKEEGEVRGGATFIEKWVFDREEKGGRGKELLSPDNKGGEQNVTKIPRQKRTEMTSKGLS